MVFVFDSNEYIFAFGVFKKESCECLISRFREIHPDHTLRVPRLVVDEVRDNLPPEAYKEFILFLNALTTIDEDIFVPFEFGAKYEAEGFKPADAFVCAYAE